MYTKTFWAEAHSASWANVSIINPSLHLLLKAMVCVLNLMKSNITQKENKNPLGNSLCIFPYGWLPLMLMQVLELQCNPLWKMRFRHLFSFFEVLLVGFLTTFGRFLGPTCHGFLTEKSNKGGQPSLADALFITIRLSLAMGGGCESAPLVHTRWQSSEWTVCPGLCPSILSNSQGLGLVVNA